MDGRTVLVTGGSGGIGRAACLGFASQGAEVVVHYHVRRDAAEEVVSTIEAGGGRAMAIQVDVTDRCSVDGMMSAVTEFVRDRGLHVLFNNTGIYPTLAFQEMEVEDLERMLAVNVRGPFLCSKAALPLLRKGAPARIINISSTTVFTAPAGALHYITAKPAIIGFTRALARELAPYRINVNCIVPSIVQDRVGRALVWQGEGSSSCLTDDRQAAGP